jgi:uncharacterized protein
MNGYELLTEQQADVGRQAIAEESAQREHVVVYLSGAHAYGFPSPDSDLDIKCVHIAPTSALLGLEQPATTFDRAEVLRGVEVDYTSNELHALLLGVLLGNGNFIERVLGDSTLQEASLLQELRPLVRRALSRKVHRHYRGFATSQLRAMEAKPTVKKTLYVLRTALTGTHLLRSGELVTDVTQLLDTYGFGEARELVAAKLAGEQSPLSDAMRDKWLKDLARAFEILDAAEASSPLPQEPSNQPELNSWLIEVRKRALQQPG